MKAFNKEKELRKLKFKQNKGRYIKYGTIGISCLLLVLGVMYFTFAKFESKSPEWTLINGRVKYSGSGDANIVAVYIGEEKVDDIPSKGSGYYFDRLECTNGATARWDNDEWGIFIKSSKKTNCTLYFVERGPAFFRNLLADADKTSTEVIDKGTAPTGETYTLAYDGTEDNNIRYVGANPANYVNYNCDSNGENCELWRIIGVFNNIYTTEEDYNNKTNPQALMKLIRSKSLGNYSWDTSASSVNKGNGINQWGASGTYEGADLMNELNKDYLGTSWAGDTWYNGSSNSKTATKPSTTLNSTAQNMIQDIVWNTGSNGSDSSSPWTPSKMYEYERSTNTGKSCSSGEYCNDNVLRTTTWYGKVALMYPSDYGYATSGGSTTNRSTCLTTSLSLWNGSSIANCNDNDWIFANTDYWTLSPSNGRADLVLRIVSSGYIYSNHDASYAGKVLPVVFLKSSIGISGGTGTSTDPYTLG